MPRKIIMHSNETIENWPVLVIHSPKFLSGLISVNLSGECNTLFYRRSRIQINRCLSHDRDGKRLFSPILLSRGGFFKKPRRRTRPCFECHKGDTTFVSSSNWKRLCVNLMSGCAFGGSETSWENWSTTRPLVAFFRGKHDAKIPRSKFVRVFFFCLKRSGIRESLL